MVQKLWQNISNIRDNQIYMITYFIARTTSGRAFPILLCSILPSIKNYYFDEFRFQNLLYLVKPVTNFVSKITRPHSSLLLNVYVEVVVRALWLALRKPTIFIRNWWIHYYMILEIAIFFKSRTHF